MTPEQIADELRPLVRGRVAVDAMTRRLYSTDASPFQITPAVVFVPRDEDDAATAMRFAFDRSLPVAARGAGTGLAGESLNAGIAIDFSVHFRRIPEIGPDHVRVQPGVTLRQLNDALAPHGRRFAPDPSNAEAVTLGGMIATNASGETAFRHGTTRDHTIALRTLNDDGTLEERQKEKGKSQKEDEYEALITTHADAIREAKPKCANRAGYCLDGDLVSLFVGSEGTLALTVQATLRTIPQVGGRARYVLGFASLDDALAAGIALRNFDGVAGADLLDQRLLSLARSAKHALHVSAEVTAALAVLHEADSEHEALAQATASFEALRANGVALAEPANDAAGLSRIERFRESAVNGFYTLPGPRRPEAFVEDIGVPPEQLAAFYAAATPILRDADLAASFLIHTLTGVVHCRPLVDFADRADRERAWTVANRLFDLALSLGGTVSAQHGVGVARTPWMEKQFPALLPVFREVKRIFDPKNILNPGKIVGPDPSRPAWPFRDRGEGLGVRGEAKTEAAKSKPEIMLSEAAHPSTLTPRSLSLLDEPALRTEARKCTSCGDCRVRTPPSRMCPVFRATGDEAATPRAKANALAAALEEPERLKDDDLKGVANLCFHCTRCRDECPATVDIPTLMLEAKAAHFAARGYDRGDWLVARHERLAALAGTFAFTANTLLSWKPTRWLMEKVFGLSRRRMVHRFTHRTFLRRQLVQRLFRRETKGTRKFAYFVDTFANFNDPLVAEATVAVLEYHGFAVTVPQRQRGSGMGALTVGDIERARKTAAYNVRTFAELVRDGHTVVCSEPTAALALKTEYPRLLKSDDAKLVAEHTVELTALLGDLQASGQLKSPFRSLAYAVGHHTPCHLKSLGPAAGPDLLKLIPDLTVAPLEAGCSGAAGVWGFSRVNVDLSLKIGEPLFDAMKEQSFGATECASCRMQIQQGTGRRVLHPIQWLALAYGLVPELERRLTRTLQPRLTG